MDFRTLLQSMTSLSEAEGSRVHKGTYGTSHGKEDVRDQYGHRVGKVDKDAEGKKDAPKKGRGRPKKGADENGEVKSYDTKGIQAMLGSKPKGEVGKRSVKHSLKDWIEHVEENTLQEGTVSPIEVKPASQTNTQVIQQGNKTLGTVTNPQLAAQIKQSIGKGEMTLNPDEQGMTEEDEGKPGKNFAKIAKSAGQRYGSKAAGERVAGAVRAKLAKAGKLEEKKDLPGKQEKLDVAEPKGKLDAKDFAALRSKKKVDESISLSESPATLQHIISKYKHEVKSFINGNELDHDLYEALFDYYFDAGEIPYGTAKGRTGDPYEWITQRFDQDVHDHVVDESTASDFAQHGVPPTRSFTQPGAPMAIPNKQPAPGSMAIPGGSLKSRFEKQASPFAFEGNEMKDMQVESWESQLNSLLVEGITVSSSTGQQGAPDSVSVNATDADAQQLLQVLRQAGVGVFGGGEQATSGYGAPVSGQEPEGHGQEPEASPDVVGDGDDMMALIKKMTGIQDSGHPGEEPAGTLEPTDGEEGQDYEDEETSGDVGSDEEGSDEQTDDEEDEVDEGNAFSGAVAKAKQDGVQPGEKINVGGHEYPVKEEQAEDCNECGYAMEQCECDHEHDEHEQVEENYANSSSDPSETELMKLKALLSMGNDMHKEKQGQAVGNPIRAEISDWKKLSGIK